jgi:hypothetical protein
VPRETKSGRKFSNFFEGVLKSALNAGERDGASSMNIG